MKRDFYPNQYVHLYERAPQFGNSVPAWWVLVDGVPVTRRAGEDKWKPELEPLLEKLVRAKLAGGASVEHGPVPPARPPIVPQSVGDAENVPFLSARGKEAYRTFLKKELPRAFALSQDGSYAWWSGGTNPRKKALDSCDSHTIDFPCKLYVVDDALVYRFD